MPRIDGCIEPKTIVKILLFSRVHALTNACTLEDSKKIFYSPGYTHWSVRVPWSIVNFLLCSRVYALTSACTLENRKISFSVFPIVMTYRGV